MLREHSHLVILLVHYYTYIVHPKFPEGTVASLYKKAVAKNELVDAVRFDA